MQKVVIETVIEIVIEICMEQVRLFQCNRFHYDDFLHSGTGSIKIAVFVL